MTIDTNKLLNERERTHGDYADTALWAGAIKQVLRNGIKQRSLKGVKALSAEQAESLDLIATKIARILAGNADLAEHWEDIAGYAKLVVRSLEDARPEPQVGGYIGLTRDNPIGRPLQNEK